MSEKGKKFKVGLIRVLTCEDPEVLYSHQRQIMEKFPDLEVETKMYSGSAGRDPQSGTWQDRGSQDCRDGENLPGCGYDHRQLRG